jgi:hypothetical protein
MEYLRQRRSCRLALTIPIRVYGIDYKGMDFSEDSTTVVVNRHGAKIGLTRQLLPDQEIRLFNHTTRKEALFRVVSKAPGAHGQYTFWGLECLDPDSNIWGVAFPELQPKDRVMVRLTVECPVCSARELLHVDERLIEALHAQNGIPRGCLVCRITSLWKPVPPENAVA